MKSFFALDGPLLRCFDRLGKLILASVLWLLVSLPVFTMGLASTALYYSVMKSVRNDRDYVMKQFYDALRREWKQGLFMGCLYLLAFALLLFDAIAWRQEHSGRGLFLFLLCAAAIAFLMISAVYVFSMISRFEMPTKDLIRIALFLEFRYLPSSVGIGMILAGSLWLISLSYYTVLFVPGTACYLISSLTERIYQSVVPKPEAGREQWYDKKIKEESDANQETG